MEKVSDEQVSAGVARLDALGADPETAHRQADEVLLEVVPPEVAEAYERLAERCAWWVHA